MTNMARKVLTRVAEAVVAEPISALTSSRADVEDLVSSRPTTFSDNSSGVKIHLLISLTMTPSRRLEAMVARKNNQTNKGEEDSKPLVQWVVVSSMMMMMTFSAGDSGAASEAGQCSNRCDRLVEAEDINKCSSQALVAWAWAEAWANLCQHKLTSRMASV